jgi:hypothetical protein
LPDKLADKPNEPKDFGAERLAELIAVPEEKERGEPDQDRRQCDSGSGCRKKTEIDVQELLKASWPQQGPQADRENGDTDEELQDKDEKAATHILSCRLERCPEGND